jgi:glyceraldehyde-3-phosphate dehydrogenase/erythrose-4-phosphate dehydrogenase
MKRNAIGGFGRIGRNFFRAYLELRLDYEVFGWYDNVWSYSCRLVDLSRGLR